MTKYEVWNHVTNKDLTDSTMILATDDIDEARAAAREQAAKDAADPMGSSRQYSTEIRTDFSGYMDESDAGSYTSWNNIEY